MPPTPSTADGGLRALRSVLGTALADLRWVAHAREEQLGWLASWRGRHAVVHRDRAGATIDRTRRVELAVHELAVLVDTAVALTHRPLLREGRPAFAVTPSRPGATVAADPTRLRAVVEGARSHTPALRASATALDERSREVGRTDGRAAALGAAVRAEARAAAAMMRGLASRWDELDAWVAAVADALSREDRAGALALTLLGLGTGPTVRALATDPRSTRADLPGPIERDQVDDARLLVTLREPSLPTAVRHRLTAELLDRWAGDLDRSAVAVRDRARTADRGLLERLATVVDDALLDPIDAVVHVRTDAREEVVELERLALGLRELAALDDVTLLDVRPGVVGAPTVGSGGSAGRGGAMLGRRWRRGELAAPTVRLAIGDPAAATHLAVLLAGTASGVGRHTAALRDARGLHAALSSAARRDQRVAVVLELYDAPVDLARAADTTYAEVAARELATGLTALRLAPTARTTLVGHSYGAVVAGRTAAVLAARRPRRQGAPASDDDPADPGPLRAVPVDAIVLLGAPGAGVATIDELGLTPGEVWAARTGDDPIARVADLTRFARAVGGGAWLGPVSPHGADPVAVGFGARRLPTDGRRGRAAAGHLEYLDEGTASLDEVVAVVLDQV